jgi:putative SOS response-associated peptidase YedK
MTVLYRLDAPAPAIAQAFAARAGDDPWTGGAIAAGGFAPVVTTGREFVAGPRPNPGSGGEPTRRMIPRLWGVPPPPSSGGFGAGGFGAGDPARGVLTVRNLDSPFWIGLLRNSEFRCLVPATGFMLWGKGVDRAGKRRPLWVSCADQPLFAFAAVWKDSEIPSFALLTCPASAALRAQGRETMPVILPADPRAQSVWLNGGWDRARHLVAPYASALTTLASPGDGDSQNV